jgi:hypothetical protein
MARVKKESLGSVSSGDSFEPAPLAGQVLAHQDLSLLEVSEAADLQSLMLDARVKPLILAAVSSTQALVLPQNTKALLEALRKAGHTPKVRAGANHV